MSDTFNTATIEEIAKSLNEPSWVTELRRAQLARHKQLPWPHQSDDVWRRTDYRLLDPMQGFALAKATVPNLSPLGKSQVDNLSKPLGGEQLFVHLGGKSLNKQRTNGLLVTDLAQAAHTFADTVRRALTEDGFTKPEQKLASLNLAFHNDDLFVRVPPHTTFDQPVRLIHLLSASARQAIFPLTIIEVGAGSSLTLIDEYVSLETTQSTEPHLINGRIEVILKPNAQVRYVRLQRFGPHAREFLLQRAVLSEGATLTLANLNLGAALSKAHIITKLIGSNASSKFYGFVFGRGSQHVDQHTLQDHQAPHTQSDLHYRSALQDESRMVYTGLIRIAQNARQADAHQANHNLLLSKSAHARTIPMLEILADDVQCKHEASVGPVDEEQVFYGMARGMPRELAERLVVMGFVESVIQQVPLKPLQERLRQEIEGSL